MECCDLLRQRFADSLHALELVPLDQPSEILRLDRLQRARARGIGAHLERILSLQLKQGRDLVEHLGDLVLRHGRSVTARDRKSRRGYGSILGRDRR